MKQENNVLKFAIILTMLTTAFYGGVCFFRSELWSNIKALLSHTADGHAAGHYIYALPIGIVTLLYVFTIQLIKQNRKKK